MITLEDLQNLLVQADISGAININIPVEALRALLQGDWSYDEGYEEGYCVGYHEGYEFGKHEGGVE